MDSLFGRRRRRRYVKRLRSRKERIAVLLVALALVLMTGATHLAIAGPVDEPELLPASAAGAGIRDQSLLITAFAAAFGSPNGVLKRVGPRDEATWFTPGTMVQASFGSVLISEGSVVSPDVESMGKLAVVYFETRRGRLVPRRNFIPAIESGSSGQIYDWRVRSDLGDYPVVEVEGRAGWGDRACGWTTLLQLTPEGPHEIRTALDAGAGARMSRC
jgi:hypothetical protein